MLGRFMNNILHVPGNTFTYVAKLGTLPKQPKIETKTLSKIHWHILHGAQFLNWKKSYVV